MPEIPKKIFFDMSAKILRDSNGDEVTEDDLFPDAILGQKYPLNVQLVNSATLTDLYMDIETGSTAEVLVDNDYSNPAPTVEIPNDAECWEAGTGHEYYFAGTSITAEPNKVYEGGVEMAEGTVGTLTAGQYGWDSGSTRLYVRLTDDTSPTTKASGYITFTPTVTSYTPAFIQIDTDTFNASNSWYDTDTLSFRDPVITNGELAFEVNAAQYDFYTRLGGKAKDSKTKMQVQLINTSADYYKIIEWNFICRNRFVGKAGCSLSISDGNVYTKAEIDALLNAKADKAGSDDIEITDLTKGLILKSSNGARVRITATHISGSNHMLTLTQL